ncbi:MAG TPA: hypothetical protein VGF34_01765 [Stellaceae bacterium]
MSQRVRQEVEDHLRQAVGADPVGDGIEAEQRAIANFGDPHVIAAQFALVSLAQHIKRVGGAIILLIAGVFIAMKARVAWYAIVRCAVSDDTRIFSTIAGSIDRYSFWVSVIIGIGGWAYISRHRIRAGSHAAYPRELRRFFLLYAAATGSLVISVISDGVLTTLRLPGAGLSAQFLVPIFSMAIEIACAAALVLQIRGIAQRATATAALLKK